MPKRNRLCNTNLPPLATARRTGIC